MQDVARQTVRFPRPLRTVLLCVLAGGAIGGALWAHHRFIAPAPHTGALRPGPVGRAETPPPSADPAKSDGADPPSADPPRGGEAASLVDPARAGAAPLPADSLVEGLLGPLGVSDAAGHPEGVAPPPGAQAESSHRFANGASVARYRWAGEVGAVREHYRRAAEGQGFSLVRDAPRSGGWQLVFKKGAMSLTVGLRTDAQDAKMVGIVVTAAPPPTGPQQQRGTPNGR